MCLKKTAILFIVFTICLFNSSLAGEPEKVSCLGKVVNIKGEPIASAKVGFYRLTVSLETMSYEVNLEQELATDEAGKFNIEVEKDNTQQTGQAVISAEKEGLAFGWANWSLSSSEEVEIKLYPAAPVSGIVVDESEQPVAEADVFIAFLMVLSGDQPQFTVAEMMPEKLITKTDAEGKFSFDNIPQNANLEFRVEKPGRATVLTLDIEEFGNTQQMNYSSGQTDIRLIQSLEAVIEGIVVVKDTGKPVGGIHITAEQSQYFQVKPTVSAEDGTFVINRLSTRTYKLQTVTEAEKAPDWIAEPVEVTTESGKTTSGVRIELIKGGLLEIVVTDAKNNQPVEQVNVTIQPAEDVSSSVTSSYKVAFTNKDGIAQFRLIPGQYEIESIYKQQYSSSVPRELVDIEDGQTKRVEYSLDGSEVIAAGVVHDENGNPVAGATVNTIPSFSATQTKTDENGGFTLTRQAGSYPDYGTIYLHVRHKERNIAAAVELFDQTENLDIELLEGTILSGKVVDSNGTGLKQAKLGLVFWTSTVGYGTNESVTIDENGHFQIKAIAPGFRYSVNAEADGFGRESVSIQISDSPGDHVELETMVLQIANLSVSGTVVDTDGKPIADARVYCSGSGQPNINVETDRDGKFTLEKVCEGQIRIYANRYEPGQTQLYGNVQAEGGATDVRIVVSDMSSGSSPSQPQPSSLTGKSLPDLEGFFTDFASEQILDNNVLLCFWDYEQRPSRNCILQLNNQAEELEAKGIIIVTIHASKININTLDEWLGQNNISFPIGIIETNQEQTRLDWGVRSLPWLILTDSEHTVKAEGFSVSEIGEMLQ